MDIPGSPAAVCTAVRVLSAAVVDRNDLEAVAIREPLLACFKELIEELLGVLLAARALLGDAVLLGSAIVARVRLAVSFTQTPPTSANPSVRQSAHHVDKYTPKPELHPNPVALQTAFAGHWRQAV